MKATEIEKPFRLTRDFWAAYGLLGVPVLWWARPWERDLPIWSRAAEMIFLPFAAAIGCYCPFLLVRAVVRGGAKERRIAAELLAALASAALMLAVVWYAYGFRAVPSRFGGAAVIVANVVFALLRARRPRPAE